MKPHEIASTYNVIAEHWDCPQFNHANGMAQHERALQFRTALPPTPPGPVRPTPAHALDIGCGASGRIIELLCQRGFVVEGVDISAEMLQRARAHHPDVRFHLADVCSWEFPRLYDFISGWDSIWHVPLPQQLPLLTKIMGNLAPGGVFIFTTGGLEGPDEVTNPCFGQPLYHAAPGIPAILRTIAAAGCACRHLEYDQWPEKHVYLIVQKP